MGYSDAYIGGYGAGSGDVLVGLYLETDPDTWEDLSADLISGNTIRGRQSALDQYQAGTCSVVLANEDRTYDPTYAASPLAGHILPMKRVKLLGVYDGVSYPLFYGYADRWTQNREGPRWGTTTMQATDGFKVLSRADLGTSVWTNEVTAAGPVAWWRFDDAIDATGLVDSVGARVATLTGAPEVGADGLVARDSSTSLDLPSHNDGAYTPYSGAPMVTALPLTLAFVMKGTDGAGASILRLVDASGVRVAELSTSGPNAFFNATNSAGATADTVGGDTVNDGNPHFLVGVWDADGNVTLYVDGVVDGTPTTRSGAPRTATSVTIGGGMPGPTSTILGTTVTVDEVMVFDTALTAGQIAVLAAARSAPWGGDLTGERIERVLDAVGWPDDLRDIDEGQTTLQTADLSMTALEHVQKVAETENGNLYIQADGTIRFEDRTSDVNQAPVAIFSDDAGGELPITFSDPEISDEQIRNVVTVSRLEGVAQTAQDASSIAAYQISSYTRDGLYHDDDDHSRYLAQFILQAYKDPVERVSNMAVNPYRDPDNLFPVILGLELTDRITLNETPQNVTPEVSHTAVVEGISHTFAAKNWGASFNLSENTAQTQAYWQLGTAGFSELGQTTRLFL